MNYRIRSLFFWKKWIKTESLEKTIALVSDYFKNISKEKTNPWISLQKLPPENVSNLTDTVVFFTTSDYEYSVHADPRDVNIQFRNQIEAFRALAEQSKRVGLKVAVRVHPHLGSVDIENKLNTIWEKECKRVEATLFKANCGINSIELARKSFMNAIYTSNIGAEIIYHRLPLIILGKTSYSNLVPEICVTDPKTLFQLLKSRIVLSVDCIFPWAIYRQFGEFKIEQFIIKSASEVFYQKERLNEKRNWIFRLVRFFAQFKLFKLKVT